MVVQKYVYDELVRCLDGYYKHYRLFFAVFVAV